MNHIYETATGRLLSSTTLPVTDLPPGTNFIVSLKTGIWNETTLDFDPRPPSPNLSTGDFFDRFTQSELEALIIAGRTNAKPAVFLKRLDLKGTVDLTDQRLISDMTAMKNAGIITAARGQEIMTIG